ncbi:MAG: hypothetical protein H6935_04825 [Thiobacillus sp.]|nr:hypothetical protein [Thiobacillus sp.]
MELFARYPLLPAMAMLVASFGLHAQEPASAKVATQDIACHALMTEKECMTFRSTLGSLPLGKSRDHFMAEHTALIRERERLCSCSRAKADTVIYYPDVKQLALRS